MLSSTFNGITKIMKLTPAHGAASLRWLASQDREGQLQLTIDQQRFILGEISSSQYKNWSNNASMGNNIELPEDVMERLGLLTSIYTSLKVIVSDAPKNDIAAWFNQPLNADPFNGVSVKQFLLSNTSINDMRSASRYLLKLRWS